MSLSLSSLLNPSPDSEAPPPLQHKDSLPPISYVQSPVEQQQPLISPHISQQPLQWQQAPTYDFPSNPYEQRPGSSGGYNEPIQLPPPTPTFSPGNGSGGRNPSSPTLDQYHVASRSPEQRKQSMISPVQNGFTLPPIQSFASRPGSSHEQNATSPPESSRAGDVFTQAPTSASQPQNIAHDRSPVAQLSQYKPPPPIQTSSSNAAAAAVNEQQISSPTAIKQEPSATPRPLSPTEARANEPQSSKAVASLKRENTSRNQSPLRESSIPVPTTEMSAPEPTIPKKRPAPTKKKGTATTTSKKAPPAKKRKVEPKLKALALGLDLKSESSYSNTPADSSPAPSTRSQSAEADDEPYDDDDEDMDDGDVDSDDVYCICRKPDSGTFMIGCDGTCDDWFHGKCVGIEERDKNLIDKYVCPNCTNAGTVKTTWKRICRRSGCRQAARVGKTKGGKDGSKYCSEECGVAYFREMMARTRGREDAGKQRSNRRKSSFVATERPSIDYDLGARGGVLAAGELKSLVNSSKTADDFKKLGEGVLSPPATPDSKSPTAAKKEKDNSESQYTEAESQALTSISRQKDEARHKHGLLKDRMKFVTMAKQAASRAATEKELKPKEYCGYDSRLEWSDGQFEKFRNSKVGRAAFEVETLATDAGTGKEEMSKDVVDEMELQQQYEVCDRKKCARHLEWQKLAVDDVRFEMSDNGDRMRLLDKEEKEIKERAALRTKAGMVGGEGSVEMHAVAGLGISLEGGERQTGVGEEMEGVTVSKEEADLHTTPATAALAA